MLGRLKRGLSILVLCAVAPTSAGAAERPVAPIPFQVPASNGWTIWGLAASTPAGEGLVMLVARRGRSVASYRATGTVTATTIKADFGELGSVSLEQVPTGRTRYLRVGCEKEKTKVETVRYQGSLEFRGEEGFTEVAAARAAPLYTLLRVRCADTWSHPETRSPSRGARLDVERYRGESRIELGAEQVGPDSKTIIGVEATERRHGLGIQRATSVVARSSALRHDRRLRMATLRPPAPFAGHGTFRRAARPANRWTGNLTVDLPGRSDVPLTGRSFGQRSSLDRPRD